MKQRFVTGVLLALLLTVLLCLPGWCFALAALIAVGLMVWEDYHALRTAGHETVSWPAWVVLVSSIPLTALLGQKVMIPLICCALLIMAVVIMRRPNPNLIDLNMSAMPVLTVVLPGLCLVSLSLADQKAVEVFLLLLTFTVPLVGDILALYTGRAIGGKKLCPQVSPNKTIAGSIGGMAGSVLAAMLLCLIAKLTCNEPTLAKLPVWWQYLVLGVLGGVFGQIGDLFASLVKRHCGIKDFSNLFPGHGGMLDRLDSVLFMAVLMYCYRLFVI